MWRTLAFSLALIAVSSQLQLRAETCPEQVAREIRELRTQQSELRSGPQDADGPMQELRQCTREALRLGLTMAVRGRASERDARREEFANCLELRIEAISNSCYCRQIGADIERSLDMQGLAGRIQDVGNTYQRINNAADRARQRGIANPLIRQYVESAEKFRRCYDRIALNTLDEIARKLETVDPSATSPEPSTSPGATGVPPAAGGSPPSANPRPQQEAAARPGPAPATGGAPTSATPAAPAPQAGTAGATVTPQGGAAITGAGGSGGAEAGNCTDLRNNIAAMDAQSNAMPGYIAMRQQLASIYNSLCGTTAARRTEYWYTVEGKRLSEVGTGDRPGNASYAATAEIGEQCAGTANPSMCALAAGAFANCKKPPSNIRSSCSVMGEYGDPAESVQAIGATPLPDAQLTIAGRSYPFGDACGRALSGLAGEGDPRRPVKLADCPADLLNALAQLVGADPKGDQTAFQLGLRPILRNGFAPPGTPPMGGFDAALCSQAESMSQICRQRQINMGPVDGSGRGTTGQAGAFNDCYKLYSRFAGMCRMNVNNRPQIAAASLPKPQPAPPPPPAQKPADAPPPKPQAPQMSAQCQKLVGDYVSAAQANDGARALSGYNALKGAGGCGVLQQFDKGPPPAPPAQAFPSRRGTPLTDSYVQPCAADQAGCAQAMRQLEQGASPEAKAALMMHAISTGLQLGAAIAGGLAAMQPQGGGGGGGGTNYNSIGNRPAARTYGQGSPTPGQGYQPPPTVPCGSGPVCTAR